MKEQLKNEAYEMVRQEMSGSGLVMSVFMKMIDALPRKWGVFDYVNYNGDGVYLKKKAEFNTPKEAQEYMNKTALGKDAVILGIY